MTFISWLAREWVFREYQLTGKRVCFGRNKRVEMSELDPLLLLCSLWRVRFVLAVGSAVFDAMFNGGMATTSTEIELPDVEPAAFLALLK